MRALVLLLLCVVLLAVLQASYIVTEAKKHNGMRAMDDAERETKNEKKMRRNRKKGGADTTDVDIAEDTEYQVNALDKADPDMPSDQPESERSGRRERVSKQDRRARKNERKERKEQRQAAKAERQAKKANKQDKNERRQGKAERKAEKKAGKKAERAEKKEQRQQRKEERQQQQDLVSCTSDVDCAEGECCIPKRSGDMFCKANRKPRKGGKRCITSCACEGDLACYLENPAADAPDRPRNRRLGKCVAPSEADLTQGTILTAAPQEASPAA